MGATRAAGLLTPRPWSPGGRSGAGVLDGLDQLADGAEGEAGDGAVGIADDAFCVDDEHAAAREAQRAERAVRAGDGLVRVGEQRELQTVLAGEAVVAGDVLR